MTLVTFRKRPSPFSPHAPFVLHSRGGCRWQLGAGRACLGCAEVLSLAGCSKCSWHSVSWATAGRWPGSQVDLQPWAPQPASLLCAGCHPAQEESRRFPCLCRSSVCISNTLFKISEEVTVWVLQSSCCSRSRIIPNLLCSDYLETDFKVCVGMVCKLKRWVELWLLAHHKWRVENTDVVLSLWGHSQKGKTLYVVNRGEVFFSVVQHQGSYENHLYK